MTFFDSQPQPTGVNSPAQTVSVLEPELMRPTPRHAHYTSLTQGSRVIGLALWLFITGILFYLASRDAGELKRLVSNGQMSAAVVSDKHAYRGRRSSRYYIDYEYQVGQTVYSGAEEVRSSQYLDTSIGDELPITYERDDPNVYRLGAVTADMANHAVGVYVVLIGVVCTLFAVFLAYIETTNKQQMLLLQEGIPATATVTEKSSRNTGKTTIYSLSYTFDVDGETVQNTLAVPYDMQEYLYPGSQFSVLYMPGNPGESVPYRAIRNATL